MLEAGLLTFDHMKPTFCDIFVPGLDLQPNTSHSANLQARARWLFTPCYDFAHTELTVPAGEVGLLVTDENDYIFAQPGMHNIASWFIQPIGGCRRVDAQTNILHGNRTIVTVEQGTVGYAMDQGQPVLLPPGLHSWKSETMRFVRAYDLSAHVVEIGPYTLVTVDEGYAAITQNNGCQQVLAGGHTFVLNHAKWRFEKFVTLKIQTDDLERVEAASADNIVMCVNSTVVWRIEDVAKAAAMATDTMALSGRKLSADITMLRNDVLKQAIASLAGFIGSVNYSNSFHVSAAAQRPASIPAVAELMDGDGGGGTEALPKASAPENPMFDPQQMTAAVEHANATTMTYGCKVLSINIISANPVDRNLMESLASGAVAAAAALQAETAARGQAEASRIAAEAKADTLRIEAEAQAQADVMRAKGSKEAAELIGSSDVAVELAKIDRSSQAISKGDKLFFGQEPSYIANALGRQGN
mmetsp:Transcript_15806/g.28487  ORF Transcript_15806/g.28487 Transcript_15806/m.28487 type:complete len:472 (+) Transcript_15806:164-1579(+)